MQTPESEKQELDEYDAKVYRASKAMVESQTASLKMIGVPFFGVKPHLIVTSSEGSQETDGPGPGRSDGKITLSLIHI